MNKLFKAIADGVFTKSIEPKLSGFNGSYGLPYINGLSSVDAALQNDVVWACVRLISETVATLPLHVYKKTKNNQRELANEHHLYDLIHNEPNQDMTAANFWQSVVAVMLLHGNTHVYKTYNAAETKVISLDMLDPLRVSIEKINGKKTFFYTDSKGKKVYLTKRNSLHFKFFSDDGIEGLSVIQYGSKSIKSALSASKASDEIFKGASRATGVLTTSQYLTQEQRETVRGHVKSVGEKGGVYVLETGQDFKSLQIKAVDAELLASRYLGAEIICRFFRVPPVMIGHGDKASSWPTSTEAQGTLFLRYVLRPILVAIEQEIKRSLIDEKDRQTYYAEYSIEALLRGDSAARSAYYKDAINTGWMMRDEVRDLENLPPMDGGDVFMVPAGVMPFSEAIKPKVSK